MADKTELTTFKHIIENNPEDIFVQTDVLIKERHSGLTVKLPKNLFRIFLIKLK